MASLSISVERGPPQQINKPQCVGEPLSLLLCSVPPSIPRHCLPYPLSLSLLRRAHNRGHTPPFFRPSPALKRLIRGFSACHLSFLRTLRRHSDILAESEDPRCVFFHSLSFSLDGCTRRGFFLALSAFLPLPRCSLLSFLLSTLLPPY